MTVTTAGPQMLTALVRLRAALQGAALPLELPDVRDDRRARAEMVNQLEDYIIPRIVTLEAPLLAVVGGSTGAGKSTLVNSLVGSVVTESGVLRPTTRSSWCRSTSYPRGWPFSTPRTSTRSRRATDCSPHSFSPRPTSGCS